MALPRLLTTAEADEDLLAGIRRMLDDAFAGDFSDDDWDHALGGWHAVMVGPAGAVLAHASVVPRTLDVAGRAVRTGYVEAVGTAPAHQGTGLGSAVMCVLAPVLHREFELGALGTGAHAFYERLGWERWQGPTFARHGDRVVRTEEDDDGIMVLRFGPSAAIDLGGALTCEGRAGDDW